MRIPSPKMMAVVMGPLEVAFWGLASGSEGGEGCTRTEQVSARTPSRIGERSNRATPNGSPVSDGGEVPSAPVSRGEPAPCCGFCDCEELPNAIEGCGPVSRDTAVRLVTFREPASCTFASDGSTDELPVWPAS